MSVPAGIAFGVGLLVLVIALIAIARGGDVADAGAPPAGWDATDAAQEWDEKAKGAGGDFGLAAMRDTAGKWAASVAALLGVLSTVAFVAGPSDLAKDVGGTWAVIAAAVILVAAGLAALATLLAALAEQGVPHFSQQLTGWQYCSLTKQRAQKAAGQLLASRALALAALVCIIAATGIAWLAALTGPSSPAKQDAVVTSSAGTSCGTLTNSSDQVALKVGSRTVPIPGGAAITLVDACP